MRQPPKESGFALLMSLLVVGVVVSVGLSILDLSLKQVRLSSNAKESEIAFHAANAGMECARFWRRNRSSQIENGQNISTSCFGRNANGISGNTVPHTGSGDAYQYEYEFSWGPVSETRCTQVNMIVAVSPADSSGITITNIDNLVNGYPSDLGPNKFCEGGSRCSTISVQGYNRRCSDINDFGVVQREVLLEF